MVAQRVVAREIARRTLSPSRRRKLLWNYLAIRKHTAALRTRPNLLVIGTMRGGTSSVFKYLSNHSDITPSIRKETQYLTRYFGKGNNWYLAHFPIRPRSVVFEASPDYLFHPRSAERAWALMPDAKIVALLRDPAERAWSHYRHMVRLGFETLSFEEALTAEAARIDTAWREALESGQTDPVMLRFSYQRRSEYARQAERWLDVYPREQLLFLKSEDLFARPEATLTEIYSFLGLPVELPAVFSNHSYVGAPPPPAEVSSATRERLKASFAPGLRNLEAVLPETKPWVADWGYGTGRDSRQSIEGPVPAPGEPKFRA